MSRIGNRKIEVPASVTVTIEDNKAILHCTVYAGVLTGRLIGTIVLKGHLGSQNQSNYTTGSLNHIRKLFCKLFGKQKTDY